MAKALQWSLLEWTINICLWDFTIFPASKADHSLSEKDNVSLGTIINFNGQGENLSLKTISMTGLIYDIPKKQSYYPYSQILAQREEICYNTL